MTAAPFSIRRAEHADAAALADFAARVVRDTYKDTTAEADLDAYVFVMAIEVPATAGAPDR